MLLLVFFFSAVQASLYNATFFPSVFLPFPPQRRLLGCQGLRLPALRESRGPVKRCSFFVFPANESKRGARALTLTTAVSRCQAMSSPRFN